MSTEKPKEIIEVSAELHGQMYESASYEQLKECWEVLAEEQGWDMSSRLSRGLQAPPLESLHVLLQHTYFAFTRPNFACDTTVKEIFGDPQILNELESTKIPQEFLLQSVRIGAIKSLLADAENAKHRPITLYPDSKVSRAILDEVGSRQLPEPAAEQNRLKQIISRVTYYPTLDGVTWANNHLAEITKRNDAAQKEEREQQRIRKEQIKAEVITHIQREMHKPGFRLDAEQKKFLRPDFATKLAFWKAFLESETGRNATQDFFRIHESEEITTESFHIFQEMLKGNAGVTRSYSTKSGISIPLEVIDPDTGWFYVLIANKKTMWGDFKSATHNNFNQWFEL